MNRVHNKVYCALTRRTAGLITKKLIKTIPNKSALEMFKSKSFSKNCADSYKYPARHQQ